MPLCELCEMDEGDVVSGTSMCLCDPCRQSLDVTAHETMTGALSDVTLPGYVIPPLGVAQALGVAPPILPSTRPSVLGPAIRRALPDIHLPDVHMPTVPSVDELTKPVRDTVDDLTSMVKTIAIAGSVTVIAVVAYKLLKKQPKVIKVAA